ncbi:hypothetical protein GCM10017774_12920 [Lentzea cavernae]|uniref:Peptide deformylase n=1 Tax=Lentzea cavernae TaxID=2020703 RepID=A0ABQ3M2S5_9PSEU|nr:hypothetical protein GCM10017774_12920 [Lentzea cavernae]
MDQRLFIWDIHDDQGIRHVGHIANPVVNALPAVFRTSIGANEGCLSVPGPYRDLVRASRATVRGQDKNGRPLVIEATGYFARCVLHETDHLNGTLYIDHLSPTQREDALAEMEVKRDAVLADRVTRAKSLGW